MGRAQLADLLRGGESVVSALGDAAQTWYRYHPLRPAPARPSPSQGLIRNSICGLVSGMNSARTWKRPGERYALLLAKTIFSRCGHAGCGTLPLQTGGTGAGRWAAGNSLLLSSPHLLSSISRPWMYSLSHRLPTDLDRIGRNMERYVQKRQQYRASWVEPQSALTHIPDPLQRCRGR